MERLLGHRIDSPPAQVRASAIPTFGSLRGFLSFPNAVLTSSAFSKAPNDGSIRSLPFFRSEQQLETSTYRGSMVVIFRQLFDQGSLGSGAVDGVGYRVHQISGSWFASPAQTDSLLHPSGLA